MSVSPFEKAIAVRCRVCKAKAGKACHAVKGGMPAPSTKFAHGCRLDDAAQPPLVRAMRAALENAKC